MSKSRRYKYTKIVSLQKAEKKYTILFVRQCNTKCIISSFFFIKVELCSTKNSGSIDVIRLKSRKAFLTENTILKPSVGAKHIIFTIEIISKLNVTR